MFIVKVRIFILVLLAMSQSNQYRTYEAWTPDGIHLMMADPWTPDNFEDDIIVDWEDNREFKITVFD